MIIPRSFLLIIFSIVSLSNFASVTYTVHVPSSTKACFIAGEMNGWTHQQMDRVNENSFTITIEEANPRQAYKYCSGPSWAYVETDIQGIQIANRNYHQPDTVAAWASTWDPEKNRDAAAGTGTITRFNLNSHYVDSRTVDVWLPGDYDPSRRYSVLYMHDGQMLFDSSTTWNGQEWMADETLGRLIKQGKVNNTIIVGIWNNGQKRHAEYFPQKALAHIPEPQKSELLKLMPGGPKADDYLKFITLELKPFIDSSFSSFPDRPHTFISGSSMGGLISLYAICEYPEIFSGAACISTHWTGTFQSNSSVIKGICFYLDSALPDPATHKIYFDHGDQGLDAGYPSLQKLVDVIMVKKGFTSVNWITRHFTGEAHSERAWAKRLEIPLLFLLEKK